MIDSIYCEWVYLKFLFCWKSIAIYRMIYSWIWYLLGIGLYPLTPLQPKFSYPNKSCTPSISEIGFITYEFMIISYSSSECVPYFPRQRIMNIPLFGGSSFICLGMYFVTKMSHFALKLLSSFVFVHRVPDLKNHSRDFKA